MIYQHSFRKFNSVTIRAKKGIHPIFYPYAKVFCNGEVVMAVGGTMEKYIVDLWSGNHPFIQDASNTIIVDEGRVNRFNKRFAGLSKLNKGSLTSTKTN